MPSRRLNPAMAHAANPMNRKIGPNTMSAIWQGRRISSAIQDTTLRIARIAEII